MNCRLEELQIAHARDKTGNHGARLLHIIEHCSGRGGYVTQQRMLGLSLIVADINLNVFLGNHISNKHGRIEYGGMG